MSVGVPKMISGRILRSAMLLSVSAMTAACSTDAMRLSDSFYSGAAPQAPAQQMSAGIYGVDQTSTGSIQSQGTPSTQSSLPLPPAGNGGYGAASVTRSTLPPPPGSAAYQPVSPAPVAAAYPTASSAPQVASVAPQSRPAASPAPSATSQPAAAAAPAPAAPQVAANGPSVTVQPGDSLNAIARRTGVSVADLRAANGLATDNIRIGQTLSLPAGSTHRRVAALGAPETTLQAQAAATPAPASPAAAPAQAPAPAAPAPAAPAPAAPAAAAPAPAAAAAPAATTTVAEETKTAALAPASTGIDQFRWPVQGRVVKGFGDKVGSRRNDGVNISVPAGTPVKAAENGVVIYAGEGLKEFGKTVLIKHDNGLVTVYGHADDILVERGATVRRGEDIAKAGMTGDTDAPMLHFEVRKDSTPVDPMTYLR